MGTLLPTGVFFGRGGPPRLLLALWLTVAILGEVSFVRADLGDHRKLRRRGMLMGMDPGLMARFDQYGTPLYARLNIRIGGCVTPRLQFGADLRLDIYVGGGHDYPPTTRYEFGPVATVFLWRGLFWRPYVHVGALQPFSLTAGMSLGYEFGIGRFAGVGLLAGGDTDVRFDASPDSYALFVSIYLTGYDLGTRHGREWAD